ncbi:Crp/Fnr family transcriptional regulator [soil metagenome]
MFEKLHQLVGQFIKLNEKEKLIFEDSFSFKQVPGNFLLISEGQVANELFFINKGLMRLYYHKNGEYITGFIFRDHLFASSYDSFLQQAPSIQYLETIEECELLSVTKERMDELYKLLPQFNVLTRKIAEQRFINSQQILSSFLLDNPEERYRKFAEKNGDLFLRVPHHIIASYLGITPVSLSRIRRRVLEKERGIIS